MLDEVLELHKCDTVSTFGRGSGHRVAEPRKGIQKSNQKTQNGCDQSKNVYTNNTVPD